jgi:hypothetical protein
MSRSVIYHCPDCGVFWYILSEYQTTITWKRLGELFLTNPKNTIKRPCPDHNTKHITNTGVKV